MAIYILKKIITYLLILFLLVQISFSLAYFAPNTILSHFPLSKAYVLFLNQLLSGQLLLSLKSHAPFVHAFAATFELCLLTLFVSMLIGIPVGIWVGLGKIRTLNNINQIIFLFLYSCPQVWIVTLVIFYVSPDWSLFMHTGIHPPHKGTSLINILLDDHADKLPIFIAQLKALLLPAIILAIQPCIITIQLVSQNVKKIAHHNYIKMAMIRETSVLKILRRHLLPNAIPTVITQLAYNTTTILFSTMVVEILFNIDGLGKWVMHAYHQHNYNIIAISILISGSFVSLLVLLSELVTIFLYPLQYKENYA